MRSECLVVFGVLLAAKVTGDGQTIFFKTRDGEEEQSDARKRKGNIGTPVLVCLSKK